MFWALWFAFALPVFVQGVCAYYDVFLTATDVMMRRGRQGLPFLYHLGMWFDVFLFAPVMAYIVSTYGWQWGGNVLWALPFGAAASQVLHFFVYVPGGLILPEAHTHDGRLTLAGWIHYVYMAVGIAILALYYFDSAGISAREVWLVSGLLFIHVVVGNHIPFKMWVNAAKPLWYPRGPVLDQKTAGTLAGTAIALAALSLLVILR